MTNREVSDKNYEFVVNVWEAFKLNNMKDHHGLYLKFDVLLLAGVFETFRNESINSFELKKVKGPVLPPLPVVFPKNVSYSDRVRG